MPHASIELPRLGLRGRLAPYLAVITSVAAIGGGVAASGENAEAAGGKAHTSMVGECPLSFYNLTADSQPPDCEPMDIPTSCLDRGEMRQIHYSSKLAQEGKRIAWQVMDPAKPTSKTRYHSENKKDFTVQDDGGIVKGAGHIVMANLFTGRALGANRYRMVISEKEFNHRKTRKQFGRAAKLAHRCGYEGVDVAFSCKRDSDWTKKDFAKFTGRVARYFTKPKRYVDRYGLCNEPYHGYFRPTMKNKTTPQAVCTLVFAGSPAIKRVNKKAELQVGELSPNTIDGVTPLQAVRDIATACGKKMKVHYWAHHAYTFQYLPNWDNPRATITNPNIDDKSDTVDATGLYALHTTLKQLHAEGHISTPQGKVPQINITENGQFTEGDSSRVVPASVAAMRLTRTNCFVKNMPFMKGNAHYNMVNLAGSAWATGFVNSYRVIDQQFESVRQTNLHPEKCVTPAN